MKPHILDITLDRSSPEDEVWKVLTIIRPTWKKEEATCKVGELTGTKSGDSEAP